VVVVFVSLSKKSLSPEELEEIVYDRFDIELKQLQILMAKPGLLIVVFMQITSVTVCLM
jgi:hypothetical protein